jgi:hypothetical protein
LPAVVESDGSSIQEQFRTSFTPGTVIEATTELVPIIIRAD